MKFIELRIGTILQRRQDSYVNPGEVVVVLEKTIEKSQSVLHKNDVNLCLLTDRCISYFNATELDEIWDNGFRIVKD